MRARLSVLLVWALTGCGSSGEERNLASGQGPDAPANEAELAADAALANEAAAAEAADIAQYGGNAAARDAGNGQ